MIFHFKAALGGKPKRSRSGPLKGGVVLDYLSSRFNFTYITIIKLLTYFSIYTIIVSCWIINK